MKRLLIGAAIVMLASPALADGGGLSGNDLLTYCNKADNSNANAFCLGFVGGVSNTEGGRSHCAPDGVTFGQDKDIVVRFLMDHPEHRHMPATFLTTMALAEAFPCQPARSASAR